MYRVVVPVQRCSSRSGTAGCSAHPFLLLFRHAQIFQNTVLFMLSTHSPATFQTCSNLPKHCPFHAQHTQSRYFSDMLKSSKTLSFSCSAHTVPLLFRHAQIFQNSPFSCFIRSVNQRSQLTTCLTCLTLSSILLLEGLWSHLSLS